MLTEPAVRPSNDDCEDWPLSGFSVNNQLEPLCQQRSEHQLPGVSGQRPTRFGGDVKALGVDPARAADKQIAADVVSNLNEGAQRSVGRCDVVALWPGKHLKPRAGVVRLDGGDLERGTRCLGGW